ncbi:hypothetical protein [Erwinia sp. S38]|uniref:hypothetical protein n=1 Tax=Erwinia sp. S38 TaxID=2769338 RepID=UPI00190CED56|nr:hypothetical protein [Erwinia sp. S38]MBK0002736.1 hypothetical protein [Erwinia sp. S38]
MRGLILTVVILIAACSQNQPQKRHQETAECQRYRTMMTAPMSPEAHNRLKVACDLSVKAR